MKPSLKLILIALILYMPLVGYGQGRECISYLSLDLTNSSRLISLAKSQYEVGEFKAAITNLKDVLNLDTKNIEALSLLSRSYFKLGQLDKALEAQKRVIKYEASYAESSYFHLALILYALERFDESELNIRNILERNPKNKSALNLLASILLQTPDTYEEAFATIQAMGDLTPNDKDYLKLKAEYFYKRGDYPSALKVSNRMISENRPKVNNDRSIHGRPKAKASYKLGLVIKAKILLAMNVKTHEALDLILEFEKYVLFTKSWVILLKAEAYFNIGQIKESKATLLRYANQSDDVDLDIIAALVKIETEGQRPTTDPVVARIFQTLDQTQVYEVMRRARENTWNYESDPKNDDGVKITNSFWFGLNHRPIDARAIFSF